MRIKRFEISAFRTFDHLTLGGLRRVNLIAGQNNVGKTALLEALWQFSGPNQPDIGLRLDQFRGIHWIEEDYLFANLFHGRDTSKPIELRAHGDASVTPRVLRIETRTRTTSRTPLNGNGASEAIMPTLVDRPHELVLTYEDGSAEYESRGWFEPSRTPAGVQNSFETQRHQIPGGLVAAYFSPSHRNPSQEDADRLGRLQVRDADAMVVDALRPFEPQLQRLVTVSVSGIPVIHADLGQNRLIPMGLLGDGMQRLLSLTLAFDVASGGMILVDEIENGIHHSKLDYLWRAISVFSMRFDVQVFATTHSAECVSAAHEAFEHEDHYDFRLIRLDRLNGATVAKSFDRSTLGTAIEADFEVR